jgi:hypothetical protein
MVCEVKTLILRLRGFHLYRQAISGIIGRLGHLFWVVFLRTLPSYYGSLYRAIHFRFVIFVRD